ncbi:MAG: hypothetical protein Solivirus1_9 [Solivirus sp.]|uniref:Uncharacterized protein n=1 Tax=Solivirus sp. TaxID=2487772 RepID=A0A3G5AF99_9VIRU|nr:MAG: hypothetical protein Solivirus1_9 [Solivirus sp.]
MISIRLLNPRDKDERRFIIQRSEDEKYLKLYLNPDRTMKEEGDDYVVDQMLPDEPEEIIQQKLADLTLEYPFLSKFHITSFQVSLDTLNFLGDCMSLDDIFLERKDWKKYELKNYQIRSILLMIDEVCVGDVWYFTHPKYPTFAGIYGLKSSVCVILSKAKLGVATKLLEEGVFPQMRKENKTKLLVPWPLPPMIKILKRMEFAEISGDERRYDPDYNITQHPETEFLHPFCGPSFYFCKSI